MKYLIFGIFFLMACGEECKEGTVIKKSDINYECQLVQEITQKPIRSGGGKRITYKLKYVPTLPVIEK